MWIWSIDKARILFSSHSKSAVAGSIFQVKDKELLLLMVFVFLGFTEN